MRNFLDKNGNGFPDFNEHLYRDMWDLDTEGMDSSGGSSGGGTSCSGCVVFGIKLACIAFVVLVVLSILLAALVS